MSEPMTRERLAEIRDDLERVDPYEYSTSDPGPEEVEELLAEVERLRAQLPDGMENCTIQFIKCPKGHGRLLATNWVDNGCPWCEIERLREENADLRDQMATQASPADGRPCSAALP